MGLARVGSREKTPRTLFENLAPLPLLPIVSPSSCWAPIPRLMLSSRELLIAVLLLFLTPSLSFSGGRNTKYWSNWRLVSLLTTDELASAPSRASSTARENTMQVEDSEHFVYTRSRFKQR